MTVTPEVAISLLWFAWFVSWMIAAAWAKPTVRKLTNTEEWRHLLITVVGFVLLLWGRRWLHIWNTPVEAGWALFSVGVAGVAFCWWARIHLGVLWSGNITRKADHRVVDTGPYRLVRHPIYTGLIAFALATALDIGSALSVAGVVLITVGFWLKARMEEAFLRRELGAEAYDAYARRTPMLIPGLRLRSK